MSIDANTPEGAPDAIEARSWPSSLTRVPYWAYQDPAVFRREQERIFEGPVWTFLCLEAELASVGAYRTTHVGTMPVVVARAEDGEIYAFENRCTHRGAIICFENGGIAKDFHCVYHAWRYDLQGNLRSIPFKDGINGKGGMPSSFCVEDHSPRKLRVAMICGLVFGSVSDDVPPIEEFIGEEVLKKLQRVLHKPLEIIGRFTQVLPCNWKLYMENTKDTYHASLLHLFFTTFKITRLSQGGGIVISENGGHSASATIGEVQSGDSTYDDLRSDNSGFRLNDTSVLKSVDEFGDGITVQILSMFPGFVLHQINNAIAVRQVIPRGPKQTDLTWIYLGFADDSKELRAMRLKQANLVGVAGYVSMEDAAVVDFVQRGSVAAEEEFSVIEMGGDRAQSENSRITEAAVRGFWKAYRGYMGYNQ